MLKDFTTISLVLAISWVLVLGLAGAKLTRLDAWYYELKKPSWQPPDWAFGPAWTTIFLTTAYAALAAWNAPQSDDLARVKLLGALVLNGALNMLWSALFFRFRRPDWALIEVPFLWLSIVLVFVAARAGNVAASYWVLLYLGWVTFATFLNRAVVQLNRPFGVR